MCLMPWLPGLNLGPAIESKAGMIQPSHRRSHLGRAHLVTDPGVGHGSLSMLRQVWSGVVYLARVAPAILSPPNECMFSRMCTPYSLGCLLRVHVGVRYSIEIFKFAKPVIESSPPVSSLVDNFLKVSSHTFPKTSTFWSLAPLHWSPSSTCIALHWTASTTSVSLLFPSVAYQRRGARQRFLNLLIFPPSSRRDLATFKSPSTP